MASSHSTWFRSPKVPQKELSNKTIAFGSGSQWSCCANKKDSFSSFSASTKGQFFATRDHSIKFFSSPLLLPILVTSCSSSSQYEHSNGSSESIDDSVKGSGTSARGRRLLKVREVKRQREYDRIHNYPAWAKVLQDACKEDGELRAVLGDSIGNPELMKERVNDRVRKKGKDFYKSKTGSVLAFKVSFRDFNPLGSYIWFELYGSPSDQDVHLIGSVIQSWYVLGRIGAFNSSNLQLANSSMCDNPSYDDDKGFKVMPSSFHDISDVEFQDNWGRVWVDLGTCDYFALDVLLNCLTGLSSEYLGIQQVVFGGQHMGDWEEGMTDPDFGYKYFKI